MRCGQWRIVSTISDLGGGTPLLNLYRAPFLCYKKHFQWSCSPHYCVGPDTPLFPTETTKLKSHQLLNSTFCQKSQRLKQLTKDYSQMQWSKHNSQKIYKCHSGIGLKPRGLETRCNSSRTTHVKSALLELMCWEWTEWCSNAWERCREWTLEENGERTWKKSSKEDLEFNSTLIWFDWYVFDMSLNKFICLNH